MSCRECGQTDHDSKHCLGVEIETEDPIELQIVDRAKDALSAAMIDLTSIIHFESREEVKRVLRNYAFLISRHAYGDGRAAGIKEALNIE